MRRLHVGVNLLYLKPGRVGGSEEYIWRLLRALETEAIDEVELTLFVNRRFRAAHPDLAGAHSTVVAPISGDSPPVRIVVESSWLAFQTARRALDVVHHVANTIPQVRTRPAVVTIHDLQPIVRPQDFGRIKGAYLRTRLGPAARAASSVATPSDYARRLLIDRFGLDGARVIVVPAPVLHRSIPNGGGRPTDTKMDRPFFVYAAITHPHKNHVTLLRAFARVAAVHPDVSLVLTGGRGPREEAVLTEIARLGLDGRVHRVGRIPRVDLDALLGRAVALTFPSRHEGYGLPVAEAMALGCPVIVSRTTALPEVVGDAGLLVDPDDIDGWIDAMLRVLDDDALRAALIAAGHERVRSLTPAEAARRLVTAYRLAAQSD
ncbi:MAG: glycosyltransferase family 4 protein [Actinomycetota bacterium]